jgi:hypothetical protein
MGFQRFDEGTKVTLLGKAKLITLADDIYIVVVKKTFRYSNVYFYNHLCRTSVFRNIIMENGII